MNCLLYGNESIKIICSLFRVIVNAQFEKKIQRKTILNKLFRVVLSEIIVIHLKSKNPFFKKLRGTADSSEQDQLLFEVGYCIKINDSNRGFKFTNYLSLAIRKVTERHSFYTVHYLLPYNNNNYNFKKTLWIYVRHVYFISEHFVCHQTGKLHWNKETLININRIVYF